MIIKGSSRAAPAKLAKHLLRTDTNERVKILELHSPVGDLTEALREWQLLADGTRGSKGLYHANIDPDALYTMTPEQWKQAVDVLEEKLGFQGQPRAVVMHEKHGRQHIHVVWQRTDIDTMTLRSDSHNYLKHEEASLALEQEFGHEIVPGKHAKRDRGKQPEFPRAEINHAEWQQAERAGIEPGERKDQITALFQHSDNGQALKAALEEAGYILAQGDRRDYVLVDEDGQIHSLGRLIKGIKAKDLREFMADIDRAALPTVAEAKTLQQQATPQQPTASNPPPEGKQQPQPQSPPASPPAPVEEPSYKLSQAEIDALARALDERHTRETRQMQDAQEAERAELRRALDQDMRQKQAVIEAQQAAERARLHKEIYQEQTGFAGFIEAIKGFINPKAAAAEKAGRDFLWQAVLARQKDEKAVTIDSLTEARDQKIATLTERQERKLRDFEEQATADLDRYILEEENGRRMLAAELERQNQLEQERGRTRDGPDPPIITR